MRGSVSRYSANDIESRITVRRQAQHGRSRARRACLTPLLSLTVLAEAHNLATSDERRLLAVYIDFENLALGFRDRPDRFDIHRVIGRLVEKGTLVVKRAYADWKRFGRYADALHEHAIELIQIPARGMTGKNSADMRLAVDVMDLCYGKAHIDTFVIVSGDSDFSPLVSKLRENGKTVIGLGMAESTSDLLRDNCDEFIYYEDLEKEQEGVERALADLTKKERQVFTLLLDSLQALQRENRDTYWASLIKETMKRKRPAFNESYYGFKSFGDLLEAAAGRGLVTVGRDPAGRSLLVTEFGDTPSPGKKKAAARRRKTRT